MKLGLELPLRDETHYVSSFSSNARWTGVNDSVRQAWLAARKKLITASDVGKLLGLSRRGDALSIYVDKLLPVNDAEPELPLNDRRRWGKAFERGIAEECAKVYGWSKLRMSGALLVSRGLPILGCTQDAEVIESYSEHEAVSYEGKTVEVYHADGWDEEEQRLPDDVIAQVQAQLLVTGAPRSIVTCMVGLSRLIRIDMFPELAFFGEIERATEELALRIEKLDPPTATFRSKEALKLLHPTDDGSIIELPREAVEWTRELVAIAEQSKALKEREDTYKNLLRQAMGNATIGTLPDTVGSFDRWSNATVTRKEHTVKASSSRTLRSLKGKKSK